MQDTAKTLTAMAWSPDGSLVYVDDRTAGDLPTGFLRAVSVATGEISTLAARDSIVRGRQTLFPVPYLADLSKLAFVEVGSGAGLRLMRSARAELRDMNGNVAAAIELPGRADDQLLLSPFWHGARADGRGVVFTILHSQSRIRTRRVDSGEMQEFVIDSAIAPLSLDWFRNVAPLALDPSGNVVGLIPADSGADAELRADGIVLIVVIGPDGRRLHAIKPHSGAEQIGLDGIAGNWISFRKKDATDPGLWEWRVTQVADVLHIHVAPSRCSYVSSHILDRACNKTSKRNQLESPRSIPATQWLALS
jgi:hypothetical protein